MFFGHQKPPESRLKFASNQAAPVLRRTARPPSSSSTELPMLPKSTASITVKAAWSTGPMAKHIVLKM